jgi:DivIVA domain-containing protein
VAADESPKGHDRDFGDMRPYVPADILNVTFPSAVRGYDRGTVDAYVKRVNRVIAELKVSASPPAAVRHALEQAGQQVHGLLQSARETAEGITASARQEADEATARAKAEAAELVVNTNADVDRMRGEADQLRADTRQEADATIARAKAEAEQILTDARNESQNIVLRAQDEADERLLQLRDEIAALRAEAEVRMKAIQADTETVWNERNELLDDIRSVANGLIDVVDAANTRVPAPKAVEPAEEVAEPVAAATDGNPQT